MTEEKNIKSIGNCPSCGEPVYSYPKSFSCSGYKESGCQFVIWKTVAGREITEAEASELLENGKTEVLQGFTAKDGKEFKAGLEIREGKVELYFQKEEIGKCPICGEPIQESAKAFGCSGYKEGCKFAIWKTVAGRSISKAEAKELLKDGHTARLQGFKSKAGREFEAGLEIREGKVELYF